MKTITISDVTKRPAVKPAKTSDGVATGMHITTRESIALADDSPLIVPAGSLITGPLSGGHHQRLGGRYAACQLGLSGPRLYYRA